MAEQNALLPKDGSANAPFNPGIGFSDPVFQSQAAFRGILTALSEPGTIHDLGPFAPCPVGLEPATAILLLTLADYETPVWMPEALESGEAGVWLRFHCGAPAASAAKAAFAVGTAGHGFPGVDAFSPGNELYPDQSTTLILQISSLTGGETLDLEGPGIPGTRQIAPRGLPAGFAVEWARNTRLYPLGVDIVLAAGSQILGLPRTTRIAAHDPRP
ncbi:phosphonate C-P lyase system protein PhnH [Rhabdaerophilum sp. SD176]|uniref:phosphonate C-P lyase system protein PhnH n=1 Tax=Rhabdaerophilum sp. SD176 TaxID=2983548 RepID=UPI0024DF44E1|nr:phosphonate C-P lyase system protein PhnH [Rhabdaerophilum sp. SD176]